MVSNFQTDNRIEHLNVFFPVIYQQHEPSASVSSILWPISAWLTAAGSSTIGRLGGSHDAACLVANVLDKVGDRPGLITAHLLVVVIKGQMQPCLYSG